MCCLSNFKVGRCNIQSAIVNAMDTMLDDVEAHRNLPDFKSRDVELDDETKSLIDAGFLGHKRVVEYYDKLKAIDDSANKDSEYRKRLNKNCDYIACLVAARKTFGKNVMFLPVNTFKSIIREYGVTCHSLSEYDSNISEKKLREITKIRKQAKKYPGTIIPVIRVISVERRFYSWGEREYNEIKDNIRGFPFVKDLDTSSCFRGKLIYLDGSCTFVDDTNVRVTKRSEFFVFNPNKLFKKEGPFFCAYNGKGILIFIKPLEMGGRKAFKRLLDFNQRLDELCYE